MSIFDSVLEIFFRVIHVIRTRFITRNIYDLLDGYPFLSLETYFFRTNLQILLPKDLEKLVNLRFTAMSDKNKLKIFLDTNLIELFIEEIKKIDLVGESLVIAHTDTIIDVNKLGNLKKNFKKIYLVNFEGEHSIYNRLPVGLEGQAYRSGGRIKDFVKKYSIEPKKRKYNFVIGWNDVTNPGRKEIRNSLKFLEKSVTLPNRVSPQLLHRIYRKSLFVISPPGNGPDSHRTWEAIYCGAVPVIKKSTFFSDVNWPIFFVDEWTDLLQYNRQDLETIYNLLALNHNQAVEFSKKILDEI